MGRLLCAAAFIPLSTLLLRSLSLGTHARTPTTGFELTLPLAASRSSCMAQGSPCSCIKECTPARVCTRSSFGQSWVHGVSTARARKTYRAG